MRTASLLLILTALTACKGGGDADDTGMAVDADQDGYVASEDCDDDNAAVFPGAEEICDGLDNDCDEEVDNGATDATLWYPDADADTYGDLSGEVSACEAPLGHVADATDCDDTKAAVNPAAAEICNDGLDDDCDGLADDGDDSVDLSTGLTWWADADADGFGAGAPTRACEVPSGGADNEADCDDTSADTYPGAAEICDGLDNSCEGTVDEGLLGLGESCPATSCLALANAGETATGTWWVDPTGGDPFLAYCDLVSDGGGWTLLTWAEDTSVARSTGGFEGEPYPGTEVCEDLSCSYGSAATVDRLQAVISASSEFGSGMSTTTISTFQALADYEYASALNYTSLSTVTLNTGSGTCDPNTAIPGVNTVLSGPVDYDGMAVYLDLELRYATYDYSNDTSMIWNYAYQVACSGSGTMPSVYVGSWDDDNWGPYLQRTPGSRSTWVR